MLPPEEPLPEPVEPPEVPEVPEPLVLPEPLVRPEPLVLLDPLVLPDPLVVLVVAVPDCPVLSPLPPPHAVIANASAATSNPLRTNDVFIMYQFSSGPTPSAHARLCAQGAIHMPPGA